jgi:glutamate carboxypeptidase
MKKIIITLLSLVCISVYSAESLPEKLTELVNINSGTKNYAGVNQVQEKMGQWLASIGFSIEYIKNPEGEISGNLLVANYTGATAETVTLVMHADTVFEPSSNFQKMQIVSDAIASGPGVVDDKGGMVVAFAGLKQFLAKNPRPKFSIRVVSTPNEEVGSTGWIKMFRQFGENSFMVLGLEPSQDNGNITHARKGNTWYDIRVTGKESHAGRDHKDGINACAILSEKLALISKLTNYKKEETVSIGHMSGGQDKFNIVCGHAHAKVDTRFATFKSGDEMMKKIGNILKHKNITFTIADETPPFYKNKAAQKYIDQYLKIANQVDGKKYQSEASGGVADVNNFSREGLIIFDGLGPNGGKMHTSEEFINLKTLESRAEILAKFLETI